MPETLRWIGIPKLLTKLDAELNIGEESYAFIEDTTGAGEGYLLELMPAQWNRPRRITVQVSEKSGRISIPSYPYIFHERGSAFPSGGRAHRRKTDAQFKAGGLRLRPRRYIRRTKGYLNRFMKDRLMTMKTNVEKTWSA